MIVPLTGGPPILSDHVHLASVYYSILYATTVIFNTVRYGEPMPTLHPAVLCVAYANVRTRRTASYIRAQLPEELIIGQHREACTIADIEAAEPFDIQDIAHANQFRCAERRACQQSADRTPGWSC
jgi:hypothetical protein